MQKALEKLVNVADFIVFLKSIKELREECIAAMFDADTAKLQQIAGQILAYDQILRCANADQAIARFEKLGE